MIKNGIYSIPENNKDCRGDRMNIKSSDFIFFGLNGFCYLPQDNTIYKKGIGQNYKPIIKTNSKPIIKVTNKEFNHKKILKWVTE